MKKFLRVGVLLILVISLAACGEKEPISVFDTDKEISAVTISTAINGLGEIQVPHEALEEIARWLKAFT